MQKQSGMSRETDKLRTLYDFQHILKIVHDVQFARVRNQTPFVRICGLALGKAGIAK
jgi:hypothetical protein